jgi:hypothetical protein
VATDVSGHHRDGTADWGGNQGLTFNGSNTYSKMPDNLMAGLDSIIVDFDVRIDVTMGSPYFLYGLGNGSRRAACAGGRVEGRQATPQTGELGERGSGGTGGPTP